MTIRTSKACVGLATALKQAASASNDSNYHQRPWRGGGGQIPVGKGPKDRRLTFFYTAAG
ncbi:hypothetical protein OIPHN330_23200 [Citrobacter freundii]|nr:hypothetical protein OIPHN330_23200 [Citrobacter freundii]BEJ39599.1 hypothetical protein OIPHN354_23110 [Citrobacter freundii]